MLMVGSQRGRVRRLAVMTAIVGCTLAIGSPAALAAGDDGVYSGGGKVNPQELKLKHENAWVKADELQFGAEAYDAAAEAATTAVGEASCEVSADAATYLALAPTWPEVSGDGTSPSPMTMSRYDNQAALADPEGRAEGLFFNPGVGVWQLDSAGLGAQETAYTAIDSVSASQKMVPYILEKFCNAKNGGSSNADARDAAWSDWHACDEGACEEVFQTMTSNGVTKDDSVGRYGGAEPRTCTLDGTEYDCLYVDPSKAQGQDNWTNPDYGPAPVPDPFYAFTFKDDSGWYEVRTWLADDTDAGATVSVSRQLGVNARDGMYWEEETTFCDATEGRGDC